MVRLVDFPVRFSRISIILTLEDDTRHIQDYYSQWKLDGTGPGGDIVKSIASLIAKHEAFVAADPVNRKMKSLTVEIV